MLNYSSTTDTDIITKQIDTLIPKEQAKGSSGEGKCPEIT